MLPMSPLTAMHVMPQQGMMSPGFGGGSFGSSSLAGFGGSSLASYGSSFNNGFGGGMPDMASLMAMGYFDPDEIADYFERLAEQAEMQGYRLGHLDQYRLWVQQLRQVQQHRMMIVPQRSYGGRWRDQKQYARMLMAGGGGGLWAGMGIHGRIGMGRQGAGWHGVQPRWPRSPYDIPSQLRLCSI